MLKKYLSLGLLIAVIFFFGFSANKIARAQDSAAGPTDGSAAGPADSTDAASTAGAASDDQSTAASEGTSDASAVSDQAGRIEALKAEFEARREAAGNKAEERMAKIDNRVSAVQMRAEKVGERIAKAQARILAVIEKVEARGFDASAAREHYDLSLASYDKVKAAFDAAKEVYASADPATTTREQMKGLRDAFRTQFDLAKEALKETQFHLKEAIKALKGLRKPVESGDNSAASPTE